MRARADGGRGTKDIRASFGGTPLLLWPWVALQSHNVVRFLQPGLEFVVQVGFRLHEDVVTAPFRSVVCRLDNPRAVQPPMQGETGKKPVLARWQASEPTLATQASRVFCGITWTSLMSAASRRMFVPARVRRARPWQSPFQRVNAHMSATGSGSPIWPRAGADPQGWLPLLSRGAPLPMHLQAMRSEEPSDAFDYPAEGPIRDGCAARRRLFPATREVSQAGPSRPALSASGVRIAAFDYRFRDLLDGFRGQEPAGPVTKTCTEDFIRWRHARAPRASGGRRWPGPRG
jgi:hypothetical protein